MDKTPVKKVRFKDQDIAQAFIDKFLEKDRDLFIPAPFGKGREEQSYWGIAIVATNRNEELEGYGRFIQNCRYLGLRPRFVFLNRIDSKLIKDDDIEKIGLPWMAPEDAEEKPIDILEPIEDEDVSKEEPETPNEPNIEGEEFAPKESVNSKIKDEWIEEFEYQTGMSMHEDVIPIDAVRIGRTGRPDGRYSAVKKLLKDKDSVQNIQFIDVSQGNGDEFVYAFQKYADENNLKDGYDYKIVKDDYVVITKQKLSPAIIDLMNQYGVSLYEETEETGDEEVYLDDIDEFTDIPDFM